MEMVFQCDVTMQMERVERPKALRAIMEMDLPSNKGSVAGLMVCAGTMVQPPILVVMVARVVFKRWYGDAAQRTIEIGEGRKGEIAKRATGWIVRGNISPPCRP